MFDWQYELQKRLQKPQVINYSQQEFEEEEVEEETITMATTTSVRPSAVSLQSLEAGVTIMEVMPNA